MLVNVNSTSATDKTRSANSAATVAVTTAPTVVLAANASRSNYSIYNAGPSTVFLREGPAVSSTVYSLPIPSGFLWVENFLSARYTGTISAIAASGTVSLQVSEGTMI